jgi:hypothetical protein
VGFTHPRQTVEAAIASARDGEVEVLAPPLGPAGGIRGLLLTSWQLAVLGDGARAPHGHSVQCIRPFVLRRFVIRRLQGESLVARRADSRPSAAVAVREVVEVQAKRPAGPRERPDT